MKHLHIIVAVLISLLPAIYAEPASSQQGFPCTITGGVTVDSLFRAIPPGRINIEAGQQKTKPAVLDRKNGYMLLSYKDQSSNTIEYGAALYTGGAKNERTFLMVTLTRGYIAQLPSTEGFWIFEYTPGKCVELTDSLFPFRGAGDCSTIKLPRMGTDLTCCAMKGDDRGLREVCTTYLWDLKNARFVKKK
jgi:hypothetical protein